MRQTVVGVFETSDEARRAQAALLDARFQPGSIRVSAGGTPRGVDEGMAYPLAAGVGSDVLGGSPASPPPAAQPQARADERLGERLSEFFRDLFSPEDQHREMARYEEAVRRGSTLVAVDVEDDLEETLASDILIRAGAYDLEERAMSWRRPDYASEEGTAPSVAAQSPAPRSAAVPGNVTSMDPADPTGYVVSRSDTAGAGMPSGAAPRPDPYLSEADRMDSERLEAARREADHIEALRQQAARVEAAREETRRAQAAAQHEAQRRQAERLEAGRLSTDSTPGSDDALVSSREDHRLGAGQEMFLDDAGFASNPDEAMREASSQRQGRSTISRNVRIYSRRADDPAVLRAAASEDDRRAPPARNHPLREETLSPELMPDERSAMAATPGAPAGGSQPPAPSSDSRAAAEAPAVRTDWSAAPVDPATDVRSELGLRSPLDDKRATRQRVLDDGAPFGADPYDDDDRRYAEGTEDDYGAQIDRVGKRESRPLQHTDDSEWDHLKRVVRDAWHRVTGHHR